MKCTNKYVDTITVGTINFLNLFHIVFFVFLFYVVLSLACLCERRVSSSIYYKASTLHTFIKVNTVDSPRLYLSTHISRFRLCTSFRPTATAFCRCPRFIVRHFSSYKIILWLPLCSFTGFSTYDKNRGSVGPLQLKFIVNLNSFINCTDLYILFYFILQTFFQVL